MKVIGRLNGKTVLEGDYPAVWKAIEAMHKEKLLAGDCRLDKDGVTVLIECFK